MTGKDDNTLDDLVALNHSKAASVKIRETAKTFVGYSNMCHVRSNTEEVVLYFLERPPSLDDDDVTALGVARIYLNIHHAKRLHRALSDTIARHEKLFGEISENIELTEEGLKFVQEQLAEIRTTHGDDSSE